jgi:hypothetical protein
LLISVLWLGIMNHFKIIIWVDAKYTYTEKSFAKVALMGEVFRGHRTKLVRWIDAFGHESSLLDLDIAHLMLVSFSP